ncbi:uncharacterized protein FTOL_09221 [Fusarium torulosum]|uniref:Secreted protein n=1 Tax=Fusarium torulosum TaxID=33205 RepID=A0AAE8SKV1_9HYPO|nr:uncharacterized protein FTOL_09221 [Fusarium torulosum]
MFGTKSPMKTLFTLAMLGNMVVSMPITPAEKGKGGNTDKVEQVFYSVQYKPHTWGIASHYQAWYHGDELNFNRTRCPVGGHNADDLYSDCYCIAECEPCKKEGKAQD